MSETKISFFVLKPAIVCLHFPSLLCGRHAQKKLCSMSYGETSFLLNGGVCTNLVNTDVFLGKSLHSYSLYFQSHDLAFNYLPTPIPPHQSHECCFLWRFDFKLPEQWFSVGGSLVSGRHSALSGNSFYCHNEAKWGGDASSSQWAGAREAANTLQFTGRPQQGITGPKRIIIRPKQ